MDIQIEKGIPLPPRRCGPYPKSQYRRWPFASMAIGDSFFYETGDPLRAQTDILAASRRSPHSITTRIQENGLRVWRVK